MTTNRTPRPATTIPTAAAILGAGGLVPFVGLALAPLWSLELFNRPPLAVLGLYAAVILSFMGAIHWGLAMAEPSDPSTTGSNPTGRYVASVLPALRTTRVDPVNALRCE